MKAPGKLQKRALGLALLVLVLDQASKWYMVDVVMQPPRVIEVTGFFNLVLTYNYGVSFGLFSDGVASWQPWALSGLALAITLGLLYWLWQLNHWLPALGVGLIVGGAIGNSLDRVFRAERAVVDFLDFHLAGWHWPAFNVADSAIVLGVAALVLDGLFLQDRGGSIPASGDGREQGEI